MAMQHEQVVLASSSTHRHSPIAFEADYLKAADSVSRHPFCGNPEGWGPLSPHRYDFTPCFLDVWITAIAVWGVLLGAAAVLYLLRKKTAQSVGKDWHFYAKLIVIGALALTTALQAALQVEALPGIWYQDFRFYTSIFFLLSLGVVGSVQYLEHWRSRTPNGVVLFYWLFSIIAYGVKLRSLVVQNAQVNRLPYFVTFSVSLGLIVLELVLEWLVPKKQSAYDEVGKEEESPYEYANVFSILTFSWITPLMKFGYKNYLTQEDLYNLRKRDTTAVTGKYLNDAWERELERKSPNLWIAMFRAFGGPYYRATLAKTLSDCLSFVQPQLLRLLINWVDSHGKNSTNPQPTTRGVAIALCMFAVSASQTMALNQYFQRAFDTGARIRASLTHMIYNKALRLSNEGRSTKTTGDIVNYMAVDTQRLQDLTQYGQQLWSAPLQITLCMISLYQLVGWSMLAGVGVMILSIPINAIVAKYFKVLQKRQMKNKDARTRLMTEILNNMKSIKLYAWTQAFMKKLTYIRNDLELNTLRKIGAMSAVQNFTWSSTPIAVSTATFTVFVLTTDAPLNTEIVFPALTLFNMLSFPLMILPMLITAIIEATVAVGRLTDYLQAEELQPDAVTRLGPVDHVGDETVVIEDGTFTWDRNSSKTCLTDINFIARKGELSCIVGRVGSGKSSLLQALLGDVWKLEGDVTLHGAVAYVAQQSWVMNASVRENIVFGHRWDPEFYEKTVRACALKEDFKSLPDGDRTEVGEKGISLSGGQKARLTLARAVYARADIYLLDDVLSAVDQHVGRHLTDNVLGPKGLLATKTRILATNAINVLDHSDYISMLREGKIIEKGTYDQLMAMRGEVSTLVKTASKDSGENTPDETSSVSGSESPNSDESKTQIGTGSASDEEDALLAPIKAGGGGSTALQRQKSGATLRRASTASFRGPRGTLGDDEENLKTRKTLEHSEQGKVKWEVYGEYAKSNNLYAVAVYMFALLGARTADILGSLWLKSWAETNQEKGYNPDVAKYIGVYLGIGLGSSLLMVIQTLILWIFCSIEASRKLHERMAYAVFRSPMNFFETNPIGRVLNRFSSDVYRVDEVLARTFNMLFVNGARAGFTLGLVVASTPIFAILIIPVGAIYLFIQRYYLRTSRELKRLDSVSKSPIYAHFQESLGGLTTIRAYRQQKRFSLENEWRVDANMRCFFPSTHANRWLAVRLELIGSCIIFAAAIFAIISITLGGGPSAGMVGLAMSYALQITTSLNWIVRQTVEVETNIVSVERCLEYARLPSEAPEVLHKRRPKANWPHRGAVGFSGYSTRYRPGLDLVLKDVNLDFKAREKIGVVGRTGAGKSSLTLALFRIIEPASGHIDIDETDTSTIGLNDLRSRLAIIPQDAALFEGTVRDNLDPSHVHDDTELWSVLDHARLKDHVSSMDGQLEARINEGGSNLSQGQRQLISLARALLTPTNILVLDEATAAVDIETDAMLQATLRSSSFKDRTIITIAHRINTILDSDRIVVLDHGKVAEFDTPEALVERKGLFFELVRESGLLDKFS